MHLNVGFISLGCAKNLVDTEIMVAALSKDYKIVNQVEKADIVIINTCGFILEAKEEAIHEIITVGKLKEKGILRYLVASGCLAQRYGQELLDEMPELDGVVGISSFTDIDAIVKRIIDGERVMAIAPPSEVFTECGPRVLSTPPGSAYLKIAEGCKNRCSYCAIPSIRGNLRSRPMEELVLEAEELAHRGVKELVLIAQDTSAYGQDLGDSSNLPALLSAINDLEGIEWIRLMYLHPAQVTEEMIVSFANLNKVIPYMDIPVQHASNSMLQRMNRRHNQDRLYELFHKIKELVPDVVLRTTVMVGFPGETDQDFEELYAFVKAMEFDWLGTFIFQAEEGTAAMAMSDMVADELKQERRDRIMRLQQKITRRKNIARVGKQERVLISSRLSQNLYRGRAYFQAPDVDGVVMVKSDRALAKGDFVNVAFKGVRHYDLIGEVI